MLPIENRIKELRLKRKLTQGELAKALGINRSTVTAWETGISNPRSNLFPQLVDVLKLRSISQIFLPTNAK